MSADTKIAELLTELHHLIKRTQVIGRILLRWFELHRSEVCMCFQEERSRSEHNLLNIQKTHERMQTENKSQSQPLDVLPPPASSHSLCPSCSLPVLPDQAQRPLHHRQGRRRGRVQVSPPLCSGRLFTGRLPAVYRLSSCSILRHALDKVAEIKSLLEERRIGRSAPAAPLPPACGCFHGCHGYSCQDGGRVQRQRPSQEDDAARRPDDAAAAVGHDAASVDRKTG